MNLSLEELTIVFKVHSHVTPAFEILADHYHSVLENTKHEHNHFFCKKKTIMALDINVKVDVRCEQGFGTSCDQTIQVRCINFLSGKVKKFLSELLNCFYIPSILNSSTPPIQSCHEPSYCKIKVILL